MGSLVLSRTPLNATSRPELSTIVLRRGDESIEVQIDRIQRDKVAVRVTAPDEWTILRAELLGDHVRE